MTEQLRLIDSIRDFPRLRNKLYSFAGLLNDDVSDSFDVTNKVILDDYIIVYDAALFDIGRFDFTQFDLTHSDYYDINKIFLDDVSNGFDVRNKILLDDVSDSFDVTNKILLDDVHGVG